MSARLIVSAGFDAHHRDPLAELNLTEEDFDWATGKLMDSGQRGKMSVSVGDEIFYGKYAGSDVEVDGHKYVILKENDILAVIER